LNLIWSRGRSS